ncbi:MAG: hypothetical protein ABRQ39_29300 [Candidatus Eremiobacterota bacterium]
MQIKDKSLKELKDLKNIAHLEHTRFMNNHAELQKSHEFYQKGMNKIDNEIGKNNYKLDELKIHYKDIENKLQMMEDYANGTLKKNSLNKEFIKKMDSYSNNQLDGLWDNLNNELDNIELNYNKNIPGNYKT